MSRPTKCRMICRFPQTLEFAPAKPQEGKAPVILTVDEYETICLIDKEGLSQEQCSQRMRVARTTAQKIYDSARKKIADALVDGLPLKIEGGEYQICDGQNSYCGMGMCHRRGTLNAQQADFNICFCITEKPGGDNTMRIAVTYEDGQIFQHFGHTEQFKVYDTEDGKIVASEVVSTNGQGHGALAGVLNAIQTDVLICGGIGGGARNALTSAGIQLYGGVTGDADAAVEALLAGRLTYDPDAVCSHHGEGHHDGDCGGHGEHHGGDCGGHGEHHGGDCGGHGGHHGNC